MIMKNCQYMKLCLSSKNASSWCFSFLFSFPCPCYRKVPLSLALSPRIISEVAQFKPDIIHASSPGIMVSFQLLCSLFQLCSLLLSFDFYCYMLFLVPYLSYCFVVVSILLLFAIFICWFLYVYYFFFVEPRTYRKPPRYLWGRGKVCLRFSLPRLHFVLLYWVCCCL